MQPLEKRFNLSTRDLSRGDIYLAGISGGRDSVALLRLLRTAGFRNLIVCHLNHGVRKQAGKDVGFSEKLAEISHLRFITDNLTPNAHKSEDEMRRKRMAFFARAAHETGAQAVFLGHHADDLAETFLWNLLRGAGSEGLGLKPVSDLSTSFGPIRILRPMLGIWRSEIDTYVTANGLDYVEDTTNREKNFTRNRLRIETIPWLEKKLGRNIRESLVRTAEILREENRFLNTLAKYPESNCLEILSLESQAIALQRRIILKWLRHNNVIDAGFKEVESIRALLGKDSKAARVNLSEDRQARRRQGKICLGHQK